ncbi:MAG: hypothetical protein NCW75_13860 [Phycisphaera sp.]|nr:MAG: hypothetical protein NCW75_13860 [Phycisphaera sp.]
MASPRREFVLRSEDVAYLDESGRPWEAIQSGSDHWVLIHEYPVPDAYQTSTVSVALQLPSSYPDVQIDMAYFSPALSRADGGLINTITSHEIDGQVWQRWSRHRTNQNPWRPGVDCIETHMLLVGEWLARELRTAS